MNNISPKVQQQISMLQQVQQQLQTIVQQKMSFEMSVKEAKKANEELENLKDDAEVFVSIGAVMMQKDKASVKTELEEKIETLELRIKSLQKQETALQGKFEQLQQQIQVAIGGGASPQMN